MNRADLNDFQDFLNGDIAPPVSVEKKILLDIRCKLNPSIPKAVSKLFVFNALGSISTLALCPQYGLSLTGTHGLMHYFMQIHPAFCFFVCGGLWMLGAELLASLFLAWDERRVLSRYYWGTGFSFLLFSVLIFACLGSLTFDIWLLFWVVGALAVVTTFSARLNSRINRLRKIHLSF